jgi:cell division protein FtsL
MLKMPAKQSRWKWATIGVLIAAAVVGSSVKSARDICTLIGVIVAAAATVAYAFDTNRLLSGTREQVALLRDQLALESRAREVAEQDSARRASEAEAAQSHADSALRESMRARVDATAPIVGVYVNPNAVYFRSSYPDRSTPAPLPSEIPAEQQQQWVLTLGWHVRVTNYGTVPASLFVGSPSIGASLSGSW